MPTMVVGGEAVPQAGLGMNEGRPLAMPDTSVALQVYVLETGVLHLHRHRGGTTDRRQHEWVVSVNHTKLCGTSRCLRIPLKVTG